MIAIVCLDENKGMLFNKRRQSRDKVVIRKIQELCQTKQLWAAPYSSSLFGKENTQNLVIEEDFLWKSLPGDYCFVENQSLKEVEDRIEKLIIFWWNRSYPSDVKFDLELQEWQLEESEEFPGYSHEKITKETYIR